MAFVTTLNSIRDYGPCATGWTKLLAYLGKTKADDEALPIITILDSNGFSDALWCLRAVEGHDIDAGLYAIWCARRVQRLMKDPRSIGGVDTAEAYTYGRATKEELVAAWYATGDAAREARDAVRGTAHPAWAVARAAVWAVGAAQGDCAAAYDAAKAALNADPAQEEAQKIRFRKMLEDGAFVGSTHPDPIASEGITA